MPRKPLCALLLILTGCSPDGDTRVGHAKADIRSLTSACELYEAINGVRPPSLEALAAPQPNGGAAIVKVEQLTDSWGTPYQYDSAGPRNGGTQPDIWAQTPQSRVIGNWPDSR
jgi:hypothetical protein